MKRKVSLEYRLMEGRIIDPETQCWLWSGAKSNGRGYMSIKHVATPVARVSAHVFLGLDLYSDKYALHKCSNKNCYNPEHLYVGTQKDNIADAKLVGTFVNGLEIYWKKRRKKD